MNAQLQSQTASTRYRTEYTNWQTNPEQFWLQQANQLDWFTAPTIANQTDDGVTHWFPDGQMNTCYMALDYHVENGRGDQLALIYDSPVTGIQTSYTYQELTDHVAKMAGALTKQGVSKGDTVVIYMPMVPQAAMAMLACARIGAIHSVVFGGFAAPELAARIDDAKPKLILSASCGIEISRTIAYKPLLDAALEQANHQPDHCVILQREQLRAAMTPGRDIDWLSWLTGTEPQAPVPVSGADPLYILYTSGTTGSPKGVVRANGGHAVALKYSMHTVYGMQAGDTFWSASDVGWVVGHSYIVYGPLLHGCTTIFYEGKPILTPDAGAFWRVINDYKVNALFAAPTAFRAIRGSDPDCDFIKQYDTSSLRTVFAAGERLDPATLDWMQAHIGVDIIDNWWQTETGWPIVANPIGLEKLPVKSGSATVPTPGFEVHILDEQGKQLGAGEQGNVAIKLPLPPGCLTTLWNNDTRFKQAYLSDYDGYYTTGDGGYIDEDGYVFIMGRVDDVINIAGHRLSTGDIEEVLSKHPWVSECAVVAQADELKGELPVGFLVAALPEDQPYEAAVQQLNEELVTAVRKEIGPLACYKTSHVVAKLPKTRSGKILRKTIKQIMHGESPTTPPTIEDPSALEVIQAVIQPTE